MSPSGSVVNPWLRHICATFLILSALSGCRSSSGELVEIELRDREKQLDELKLELDHRDAQIRGLEADIERLQRKAAKAAGEPVGSVVLVKKITLGRSSGGYDQEPKIPGDEALLVVLEPRDMDDQTIKAPGAVHIDLFEINPQGLEFLISTWDLTAKEVRQNWDAPLIGGTGYRLVLPWKSWPNYEELRAVVQFTTPEGQRFQADKKFSIRLPERHKAEPLPAPKPLPSSSPSGEEGPVFVSPPSAKLGSLPPVLEPPVPLAPSPTDTAATESGETSPSPRAKSPSSVGVGLRAPKGARRIESP